MKVRDFVPIHAALRVRFTHTDWSATSQVCSSTQIQSTFELRTHAAYSLFGSFSLSPSRSLPHTHSRTDLLFMTRDNDSIIDTCLSIKVEACFESWVGADGSWQSLQSVTLYTLCPFGRVETQCTRAGSLIQQVTQITLGLPLVMRNSAQHPREWADVPSRRPAFDLCRPSHNNCYKTYLLMIDVAELLLFPYDSKRFYEEPRVVNRKKSERFTLPPLELLVLSLG